ncbi:MAG: AAA family ATPase [Bacteroidetes bacterium]|jgi:predicted ATPase|nr:AAA family ATPase [Bacteroidota bacterium]
MLIEFKISNHRSVCEEQNLSLVPAKGQQEHPSNILKRRNEALNSVAIYGANSSGKSNLLQAFDLFKRILFSSARASSTTKLPYDPFLLRAGYDEKPTELAITFEVDETRYRYGFAFNQEEVLEEWLFRKRVGREVELFYRERDVIEVSSGFGGSTKLIDTAVEATRPNALFLSLCDMLNVGEAKTLFQWFRKMTYINGLDTTNEELSTINLLHNDRYAPKIKAYLNSLELGFSEVVLEKKGYLPASTDGALDQRLRHSMVNDAMVQPTQQQYEVSTVHATYDEAGKRRDEPIVWPMQERESAGTRKAFQFSGPVLHTLFEGGVLIIDEIEAKIHPVLTLNIIQLFLSGDTNPKGAQLVFATHDTNLLSYARLRRDQIYFVEKNDWDASEIFSLSDFKYFGGQKERHDVNKERRYLEGRYGAVPVLGQFQEQMTGWHG